MALPVTLKWHHAGINVRNVDNSIRWYRDILGFQYVARDSLLDAHGGFTIAWMEHNGFYLELFQKPEAPKLEDAVENDSVGVRHLALCLSPADFDILREHLVQKGVVIEREYWHPQSEVGRPGGLRCMFVLDPDGIRVELMEEFFPGAYGTNLPTPLPEI